MSNSDHPLLKRVLPLALTLYCWTVGFSAPSAGQGRLPQAAEIPADDYVARAKELIRALYPNLDPRLHVGFQALMPWREAGIMNSFHLQLSTYTGSKTDADGNLCDCEKIVLGALFSFDHLSKDRELMSLSMTYPVADAREASFGELIRKHSEWSEAQVIQAMKEAGGKYGPDDKDQLLHDLPLGAVRPFIGELKVEQAEFVLNRPEGTSSSADQGGSVCFWRVTGASHLASGATREYGLIVDAFDAKLSSIFSH